MAKLIDCFGKMGKLLSEQDKASISALAESNKTGSSPETAEQAAVQSHKDEVTAQLASIYNQAGVKPPKGFNALQKQEAGASVRGVQEQLELNVKLPTKEGGGGIPPSNVPPRKAPGRGAPEGTQGDLSLTGETAPEDAAERAAIDAGTKANKDSGLPSNIVYTEGDPANGEPFAGQIATVDHEGNIVIRKSEYTKWLAGIAEKDRAAATRSLLSEEGIHAVAIKVLKDPELAALWHSLSDTERALVERSYGTDTDVNMGHEYLRRQMQRLLRTPLREVAGARGYEWLSQKAIDLIERVIIAVRRTIGTKASTELDAMLSRLQDHIAAAKGETGGAAGVQTPSARRKKPSDEGQQAFNFLPPAPGEVRPTAQEVGAGKVPEALPLGEGTAATERPGAAEAGALRPKTGILTVADIGWGRETDASPAFKEFSPNEQALPVKELGKLLTVGGAENRDVEKPLPETYTKRVTAFLNNKTGQVDLLSTYRTTKGQVYVTDPWRVSQAKVRPHVPLEQFMANGNRRPYYSVLLDDPVSGFHQRFENVADFKAKFADDAEGIATRRHEGTEEGPTPQEEGRRVPGALDIGHELPLTDAEAGAIVDHLYDEVGSIKERGDVVAGIEGLKAKAEGGTLKGRDYQVINALQKISQGIEEKNPELGIDAAIEKAIDQIYENATKATGTSLTTSREDFVKRTMGMAQEAVGEQGKLAEGIAGAGTAAGKSRSKLVPVAEQPPVEVPPPATEPPPPTGRVIPVEPAPAPPLDTTFRLTPSAKSLRQRATDTANEWNRIKASVAAAFNRRPVDANLTAWRDGADTIANNNGNQALRAVEIASGAGKRRKAKDTRIREEAVAIIQSKNDPVGLSDFVLKAEVGMTKAQRFIASADPWERRAGAKWLKAATSLRDIAQDAMNRQTDPILQRTAQSGRDQLNPAYRTETQAGSRLRYDENYVPGRYEGELFNDDSVVFGQNEKIIGKNYRKAKRFPSYWDAIAVGPYIPKSMDLADLVGHRVRQGQRQLQPNLLIDRLKTTLDPVTGQPIVRDMIPNPQRPNELIVPDLEHESFRIGTTAPLVAVRKGYESILKQMFMPSGFSESKPVQGALWANGVLKHGALMILDSYHVGKLGMIGLATGGKKFGYNAGFSALEIKPNDMALAVRNGMISQADADWATGQVSVRRGTATQLMTRQEILKEFQREGLNVGRITDALYAHFYDKIPFIGPINRWIFSRFSRGLMAQMAVNEFERLNAANPTVDARKLMRKISLDTNILFGNIGRQGLIRNQALRDLSQIAFLAPGWAESLIQKEVRFATRLGKAPFTNDPIKMGTLGRAMGRGLATFLLLTQAANLITRHKLTFDNEEEGHKLDAWIPDFTGKTKGFWFSPLSVFAETSHDLVRYFETKNTGAEVFRQMIDNKLGFIGRALMVFFTGKSPMGDRLTTTPEVLKEMAKTAAPIPISIGKYAEAVGHKILPNVIPDVAPGVLQRQSFASAGMKIEPAQSAVQEISAQARKWMETSGKADHSQITEFTDEPSYYNLRRAIRAQDDINAKAIIASLLDKKSQAKLIKGMADNINRPFTGTPKNESAFRAQLSPHLQSIYYEAKNQKRTEVNRFKELLNEVLKTYKPMKPEK